MSNTILPGYETPIGAKLFIIFDHYGPASYTQYSAGSGGDAINASDLGRGGFDDLEADMTDPTGQLYAYVVPGSGAAANVGNGNAWPSAVVVWYSRVTATVGGQSQSAGTQVAASTNLSTFALRMRGMMV